MWDLYKCTGPTVGHLQHFFCAKRQMSDKCPGGGGGGMCTVGIDWAIKHMSKI